MRGGGDDQPELGEAGHGLVHVGVLGEGAGGSHHQPEDDVDAGDQPQARRAEPDGRVDERDGGQQAPRQEGQQRPHDGTEPPALPRSRRNLVTPAHEPLQGRFVGAAAV